MQFNDTMKPSGVVQITTYDATTGEMKRQSPKMENLMLNVAFSRIAAMNVGGSNTVELTKVALGTGVPVIAGGTTALTTEVGQFTRTDQFSSGATATFSFFITDADLTNGVYTELGLVTADDALYTILGISPAFTKSANEDTRIDYEVSYEAVV